MNFIASEYPKYKKIGTAVFKIELLENANGKYESVDIDSAAKLLRAPIEDSTEAIYLESQNALQQKHNEEKQKNIDKKNRKKQILQKLNITEEELEDLL